MRQTFRIVPSGSRVIVLFMFDCKKFMACLEYFCDYFRKFILLCSKMLARLTRQASARIIAALIDDRVS